MAQTKEKEISTTVVMQQHFYRDQYRRLVFMTGFIVLANIFCVLIIVYLLLEHPSDVLVPADVAETPAENISMSDLTITPRIPLNKPNMEEAALTQWVANVVTNSFNYSLQTYQAKLNSNRQYYARDAWGEYITILQKIVRFDSYTNDRALISVIRPQGALEIHDSGTVNGVYTWVYDFPVAVQFSGTVNVQGQAMTLRITVSRTSMENDVTGVKITDIQALKVKLLGTQATPLSVAIQ